jgi:thiamine pyrophosphate-dependent acetolactate synthase large subunit-like protein
MTRPAADQMVEILAAPGVEHFYGIVGDTLNGFTDVRYAAMAASS